MAHALLISHLDWRGDARLYRVVPPVPDKDFDDAVVFHEYVIVSRAFIEGAFRTSYETVVFAADGVTWTATDMRGINGGRGWGEEFTHEMVLNDLGYKVVQPAASPGLSETPPA